MTEPESSANMPHTQRSLIDHFSRSLSAFQASGERFRALYTLPWSQDTKTSTKLWSDGEGSTAKYCAFGSQNGQTKRLVVLDSSFNPPTRAHAAMLRSALVASHKSAGDHLHGTRVLLLLAVKNADKAPQPASFPSRLGMMTAFGREMRAWPESRDVSFDVGVTTEPYFHDKAEAIRSSGFYGNEEQPEQVFLAGFDTLIRIFNPKYYTEGGGMQAALGPFFETSRLRVTLRADDEWGSAEEQRAWVKTLEEEGEEGIEARGGNRAWLEKIELVDGVEGEAVSSSRVREAVSMGSEVAGMVGEEVKNWIDQEGLYREK